MLIKILIFSIVTEALVEILRKSYPMAKIRSYLDEVNFFSQLLNCGWCCSIWAGLVVAYFYPLALLSSLFTNWVFSGIIYHRLSNYIHTSYDYLKQVKYLKQYKN